MSDEIRAVVFDLGGVLIDWNPRYVYREIFRGDEDRVEWFLSEICTAEWNAQQDAGRTLAAATEALVAEHPEHEKHIRAYYDRWQEMIGGSIDGSVEILREVRDGPCDVYALTNWSAETFPVARRLFRFLEWFDGIVVSGEIGLAKPDAAIFHHLEQSFTLDRRSTVFIDDSVANVETARTLGYRAVRFEHADQLRQELHGLGVALKSSTES